MQFDPMYKRKPIQDDWAPIPNKTKRPRRKLILLPTRKYFHYKGTMKRVRVEPEPAIPCVVMRWMNGQPDAVAMDYLKNEKLLVIADNMVAHEFPSRSEAKKAIYHTVQFEKIPGGHVDFEIINKE